jgi:Transposase DDE domain group 1
MENRIKECQLDLYADRTSAATMRANQLRLWFASMAYVLLCACAGSACMTPTSPTRPSCSDQENEAANRAASPIATL